MFFLVAFGILFGMHYYLFAHLRNAFPELAWLWGIGLGILLSLPFLLFFTRSKGKHTLAKFFARSGFSWIGALWVAVCVLGMLDLLNLVLTVLRAPTPSPQSTLFIAVAVTTTALLYGAVEARAVRLRTITIRSPRLASLDRPIRLIQITDLHLGYVAKPDRLKKLLQRIRNLEPDIIVSTGDLFDGNYSKMAPFTAMLRDCEAPLGKFAVSGNHEVYEGLHAGMELTRQSGFRILSGETVSFDNHLTIAGVADAEALAESGASHSESSVLRKAPSDAFVVLLKHRPDVSKDSINAFDLQLSGHTHGGQIFPFGFLTRLQYPSRPGLTRFGDRSHLYLSRGTGTWGPQIRILAPPEITLFELHAER